MHRSSQVPSTLILGLAMNTTLANEPTPPANCTNTEVNGYQALSYECLGQQMIDPNSAARTRREQELNSTATVRHPLNQLDLYNQSMTHIRLGTSFDSSVEAQWPPRQGPPQVRVLTGGAGQKTPITRPEQPSSARSTID